MRSTSRRPSRADSGFTLLEITLVISVLLGLIAVTFIGVHSYKKGANRAFCIQNIAVMQRALRAYSNLHEKEPGDIVSDLPGKLTGPQTYLPLIPDCPAGGSYTYGVATGNADEIPPLGTVYLQCDLPDHVPSSDTQDW